MTGIALILVYMNFNWLLCLAYMTFGVKGDEDWVRETREAYAKMNTRAARATAVIVLGAVTIPGMIYMALTDDERG